MNHALILPAIAWLPTDHSTACRGQLTRLDVLVAELEALSPGDPSAHGKCFEARVTAQALFTECSGHANGGRPDRWFLSILAVLNECAKRHGLEQSHTPFSL